MNKIFGYILGALILTSAGCGDDAAENAALAEAWLSFENKDYAVAYDQFSAMSDQTEAIVGLGWCALRLDSFAVAHDYFASISSENNTDAYAGWTIVGWKLKHHANVISRAEQVRNAESDYVFTHDPSVTIDDMILHEAYSHFHLGQYTQCNAMITLLDNTWSATTDQNTLLNKLESMYVDFD
jgi:hypothetical protein